jgi:hypothetical protein
MFDIEQRTYKEVFISIAAGEAKPLTTAYSGAKRRFAIS